MRLDPGHALAYANRGLSYANLGQHQRAIEDYDEAIRLDPGLAPAYGNRGVAYYDLGSHPVDPSQFQRAIEDYDEAIRLKPEKASLAYANRGLAYANLGQLQRAIKDFDEAIRLDPRQAQAYAGRAFAHTLLAHDEAAQMDVDRAVEFGYAGRMLNAAIEEAKRSR